MSLNKGFFEQLQGFFYAIFLLLEKPVHVVTVVTDVVFSSFVQPVKPEKCNTGSV